MRSATRSCSKPGLPENLGGFPDGSGTTSMTLADESTAVTRQRLPARMIVESTTTANATGSEPSTRPSEVTRYSSGVPNTA